MTGTDLEAAEQLLFPGAGKGALAAALGVERTTLWRYAKRGKLPGPVSAAVAAWTTLKRDFDISPPPAPCSMGELEEMAEMADPGVRRRSGLLGIEAAAFVVFGDKWKSKSAAALGIDYSTLWRQIINDTVHGPVIAAFRAWLVLKRMGVDLAAADSVPQNKRRPKYARLLLEDD